MTVNAIPSVVAAHGVVYVMSGYRGAPPSPIPLDSTGDVTDTDKVLWQYGKGTPYVPSPLLLGDRLYFTQANETLLTILDTKTGKAVLERGPAAGREELLRFAGRRRGPDLPRRSRRHDAGAEGQATSWRSWRRTGSTIRSTPRRSWWESSCFCAGRSTCTASRGSEFV